MGNIVGNPIDEAKKKEIEDLVQAILHTFTTEYVKAYGVALLEKIEQDVTEQPEEWELLERPEEERSTEPLKEGYLVKQGGVRKNWLKRYFVVQPDYKVAYYETEEAFRNNKDPKGVIAPCGYSVQHDPVQNRLEQLAQTARKMGAAVADLPKPDAVPDHCFEIHHTRRRCYFIQAENADEKRDWVKAFKRCAWKCRGFKSDDEVSNTAFIMGIRATRHDLGRWGWWSFGGTESQILTDLIVEEVDYTVMSDVYQNLKGPATLRWMARSQVLKVLDTMVSGAVATSWAAMKKIITTVRERAEPIVRSKMSLIYESKEKIQEKITDACLDRIRPVLGEKVAPRLSTILEILFSPMSEAFSETRSIFEDCLDTMLKTIEQKNGFGSDMRGLFRPLDRAPRSWYTMYKANKKVDTMEVPLWGLRQFFDDIEPSELISEGQEAIAKVLDNAVYTFESELMEMIKDSSKDLTAPQAAAAVHQCKESVQEKFSQDGHKATVSYFKGIMVTLAMPVMMKVVNPICEPILKPIADLVPEELSDVLDVEKLFEETVEKVVQGAIDAVVDPACASHAALAQNGAKGSE